MYKEIEQIEKMAPFSLVGGCVLCAVSGGPDSMFLLHSLQILAQKNNFCLYAIHINHQIRAEAGQDEAVVRKYCEEQDIPLTCFLENIPNYAQEHKISLELAGRERRRAILLRCAQERNSNLIALGHHCNDQAETVLMNLARGAGARGMAGMKVFDAPWWRPMLKIQRSEIIKNVQKWKIPFVVDASNVEECYTRNRYRKQITKWEKEQPHLVKHIAQTAQMIGEDDHFLQLMAHEAWVKLRKGKGIDAKELSQLPRPIGVRVILQELRQNNMCDNVNYAQICSIIDGCDKNKQWDLPNGIQGLLEYGVVSFHHVQKQARIEGCFSMKIKGETETPWGLFIAQEAMKVEFGNRNIAYINREKLEQACIRMRRAGDRIIPFGMEGHKKIHDVFIDAKIPKEERNMPLLALSSDSHDILWIVGHMHGANLSNKDDDKNQCIKIEFFPNME